MSKFTTTQYGSNKEILKFNNFVGTSVIISDEGVATVNGKKTVKAGTIVGGESGSVLEDCNIPVIKQNNAEAEGVLLFDVDVTHGPQTGSMIIFGFVNLAKLPEAPVEEAKTALNMIKFMN